MDGDKGQSWEPESNIPAVLQEKFEAGQKELMLTVWDKCSVYGVTSVRSYQVPESEDVPIAKRRKCTGDKNDSDRYER